MSRKIYANFRDENGNLRRHYSIDEGMTWHPDNEYGQSVTQPGTNFFSKFIRGLLIAMLILGLFAGGVFVVNNVDFSNIIPDSTLDYGTLQVTSNPSGLRVVLDGEYIGTTPLYRSDIKEGYYSISLIDGVEQPLEIVAGETTTVNLAGESQATKNSGGSMTVMVKPDVPAAVYVDGIYHGVTMDDSPLTVTGLSDGNHLLLLRADGYADLEYPFTTSKGNKQSVAFSLTWW